jgi:hypothetical protein
MEESAYALAHAAIAESTQRVEKLDPGTFVDAETGSRGPKPVFWGPNVGSQADTEEFFNTLHRF